MSFTDPDPVEDLMGVRVEEMTPDELVAYIKTYQAAFDLVLAVEGVQERSIFKGMQRVYGQRTAGQIVKWVFYTYKGVYDGQPVRFNSFALGRKWWVDKMHLEMQQHMNKQAPLSASRVKEPGVRVLDF
jgi:hypothetical protein